MSEASTGWHDQALGELVVAESGATMRTDAIVTQDIQCGVYIEGQIAVMFIAAPPAVVHASEDLDQ